MGKIVVTEFISLDGVIEDPGGSEDFKYGGWSFEFSFLQRSKTRPGTISPSPRATSRRK